jgi:hypothetical protein
MNHRDIEAQSARITILGPALCASVSSVQVARAWLTRELCPTPENDDPIISSGCADATLQTN